MCRRSMAPAAHNQNQWLDPVGPPGITRDTFFVDDTTLLQPIPFVDMDKDDHESIKLIIARLEGLKDSPAYDQYVDEYKLTGSGANIPNIQVGRGVFQVIAVSISHTTDPSFQEFDPNPSYPEFGIYGVISFTSPDNNKSCLIYERNSDDPETFSPNHDELSLTDCPIAPFMKGTLKFNLTTTDGLRFVASKDVDWFFKDNCEDENELIFTFDNGYYAVVIYTIVPYALIGLIKTRLYGPPNSKKTIYVDGKITVQGISFLKENKFEISRSDERTSFYHRNQSRTAVVVAAHSWMHVDISLKTNETDFDFATGVIGTTPSISMADVLSFPFNEDGYGIRVYVEWILPDEFFSLLPKAQLPPSIPKPPARPWVEDVPYFHLDVFFGDPEDEVDVKCSPNVIPEIDQPSTTVTSDCSLVDDTIARGSPGFQPQVYQPPAQVTLPDHYVEVFSVFLGCRDSTLHALSGTILVRDRNETVYIYSRKTLYPDKLLSDKKFKALVLTWPGDRWILDEDFYMHLKLNDDKGEDVCWGNLSWSELDCPMYYQRFDRRMCAVIPGVKNSSFAAFHYSIFRNAQRAKVTVRVECKGVPCQFLDVCGSIYAEYDNHDYSSSYDKEFYRIIILDRPWEYRAKVKSNCSEIPLSKSLVTAPSDCQDLIFSVDLIVCPFKQSSRAYHDRLSAQGTLRFMATKNKSFQIQCLPLMGGDQQRRLPGFVTVKVEWFDRSYGSRLIGDSRWSTLA